ncbi:MAG: hypothetical protein ACE5LC_02525 [Candidatus Aminicenantales bacterium]
MAGAGAGARSGASALPSDWLSRLEARKKIEEKVRQHLKVKHSADG